MVASEYSSWTRSRWLASSMEVLAREGFAGLSLNRLVDEFHVTKGSFYWHFEDQADFQSALVDHWHETSTLQVARAIDKVSGEPAERLKQLMKLIVLEEHAKYDNVVSALSVQNIALKPKVQATHEFRMDYVRKLFSAMGCRGKELSMRTKMCVAFMMSEAQLNAGLSIQQRVAQIPVNLAFLTERR